MKRQRKPRLPFVYEASFARGTDRRTFRVRGWNKDDAYVEAVKRLEASGEKAGGPGTGGWWYVGADRV